MFDVFQALVVVTVLALTGYGIWYALAPIV